MKAVFDTNILIDYLNGIREAKEDIERHRDPWISMITRLEVLVGAKTADEEEVTRRFLSRFRTRPVDEEICEESVTLRKTLRLPVPDAIIYATARVQGCMLVTRNTRDFPRAAVDVRCPYQL